jgi:hypothetical protein
MALILAGFICSAVLANVSFAAPDIEAAEDTTEPISTPAPTPASAPISAPASVVSPIRTDQISSMVSLLPYIEWQIDNSNDLTIVDIMNAQHSRNFKPWTGKLPRANSTIWLRVSFAPMPVGLARPLFIYLGKNVSSPHVWMTSFDNSGALPIRGEQGNIYPLLSSARGGYVFIRLADLPPLTFAPAITPSNMDLDARGTAVHQAALIALALAALLCIGRGIIERQEWRVWGGLFSFAAFLHILWGQLSIPEGMMNMWDLPGFLAPGIALFAIPHVGRHLMFTREGAPALDTILLLLSLVGLCVGIVPFAPDMGWLLRYLPLWPALLIIPAILAIGARIYGLPACFRFLLICLLPITGAMSLFLLPMDTRAVSFAAQGTLVGFMLAAMLLALSAGQSHLRLADLRRSFLSKRNARINAKRHTGYTPPETDLYDKTDTLPIALDSPIPVPQAASGSSPAAFAKATPPLSSKINFDSIEQCLRVPLDALMRHAISLDHYELPEAARRHVGAVVSASKEINTIITNPIRETCRNE